jgi:multicomponent Na+:H+ antiporter subunit D
VTEPGQAALVLAAVAIPFLGACFIPLFGNRPNPREAATLATSLLLLLVVALLVAPVLNGVRPQSARLAMLPGVELGFRVEPLGLLFALTASSLWIVNSIYSIGYMRALNEPRQTSYYVFFAIALGSTIGVAFANNLLTLFLFYELLTISTYPLVTHRRDAEAITGGRIYLLVLLGASMVLLLPALIITWVAAGTLDFAPGGILAGKLGTGAIGILLALYAFGLAKAALMPLHFWLPAAMVAPTPVSALLHAVAVVKAGVFAILKVAVYVFGIDTLRSTGASDWLIYVASASLLLASLIALTRDNLKARLAYSTVSQLAYVTIGTALANANGIVGGGMQIVMHAAGKITLFFCAGAIYVAHHKTEVSHFAGIGRKMPVTMTAFLIGSLSVIGLPPFGGSWSKWVLMMGALDAGQLFSVAVLMLSTLLSAGYLLPIVGRAFFAPAYGVNPQDTARIEEAPLPCLIALSLTAAACLLLFFLAGDIERLLQRIFTAA